MNKQYGTGLMWFRRDLRIDDNLPLRDALAHCQTLHCVFVFDTDILDTLPRVDRRVEFIRESLADLDGALRRASRQPDAGLIVCHASASHQVVALAKELHVEAVFAGKDYEPQAQARDARVRGALADLGISLHLIKDQVVFEAREILTQAGTPYSVFTPYKKAWLARFGESAHAAAGSVVDTAALAARPSKYHCDVPSVKDLGFEVSNLAALKIPTGATGAAHLFAAFFERMDSYHETRDFPAVKGPSYLSVHLRFGTMSIRKLAATAMLRSLQGSAGASTWLGELIWRDFYFSILANFPHVAPSSANTTRSSGNMANLPRRCSRPGAMAAPVTRWWMRPWRKSIRPVTCTTACAWSWAAFW
jgi:deoxyribodipyrimidine photo-lyase